MTVMSVTVTYNIIQASNQMNLKISYGTLGSIKMSSAHIRLWSLTRDSP